MTRTITGFSNPTVKFLRSLRDKKHRRRSGQFLVEGMRLLMDASDTGRLPQTLVMAQGRELPPALGQLAAAVEASGGEVIETTPDILTKTGIILGMGEEPHEIRQAMADLREAAVDILTLGQYLRPSPQHIPVARWVTPAEFAEWKRVGEEEYGFRHVESGPLVRSSYHAKEQAREVEAGGPGAITEVLEADIPAPAEIMPELNQRMPTLVQIEVGRPGTHHS